MRSPHERPFVCSGSPVSCCVFLVGFNPATRLESPFWDFCNDSEGFDRTRFINEYESLRPVKGVRLRLNAMVPRFPIGSVLETNICSESTKKAADLKPMDRRTDIFQYLFEKIRPRVVFIHSNEPIKFFRTILDTFPKLREVDLTAKKRLAKRPLPRTHHRRAPVVSINVARAKRGE